MRMLTPRVHGYLDYLTVLALVIVPTLVGLSGATALLAYLLAVVHLAMTLFTTFPMGPMGVRGVVPLALHGLVEVAVGVALSLIGLLALTGTAQLFYMLVGLAIVLIWLLTDYRASGSRDG